MNEVAWWIEKKSVLDVVKLMFCYRGGVEMCTCVECQMSGL